LFDKIEEALDQITLAIKREVAIAFDRSIGFWRDNRLDGAYFEALDEGIGVITLVGKEGLGLDFGDQSFSLGDVVDLAARC
jgi:hypothetical protein